MGKSVTRSIKDATKGGVDNMEAGDCLQLQKEDPTLAAVSAAFVRRIQEENAGVRSTRPTKPPSDEREVVASRSKKKRCEVCGPKMDRKTQFTVPCESIQPP
ncbi:hypothetical protein WMY93_023242 [Mugilogobius chulae]|uniref:Uncharacterized protein n=1 Tax=Mugilogobius chulae TaxID=88201 RepID=A0AAW0NG54_9GOBI